MEHIFDIFNIAPAVGWLESQSHSSQSTTTLLELLHKDLTRLMVIDGKMQKIMLDIKYLVGVVMNQRRDVHVPEDDIMVSGSIREGCMLARWFDPALNRIKPKRPGSGFEGDGYPLEAKRNPKSLIEAAVISLLEGCGVTRRAATNFARGGEIFRINADIEVDIMYIVGSIPEEIAREVIHSSRHGLAHVTVEYTYGLDQLVQSLLRPLGRNKDGSLVDIVITDGFVDANKVKEVTKWKAAFRYPGYNLANVLSLWFGVPVDNINIEVSEHRSQASYMTALSIQITDKDRMGFTLDHVPSIHIPFWPDVAKGYLTRKRKWPASQDIVNSITQEGCHLIPRPPEDDDQRREFRWSFPIAEIKLTSLMTPNQRKAYMLFKILYYRYLNELNSYFAKTVMLWTAEEYPPSHPIWSTDGLPYAVHFLLLRLQVALYRQNLPMFFIPEVNLIEKETLQRNYIDIAMTYRVITAVRPLQFLHVPFNLSAVVDAAEAWHTRLDTVYQVAKPFIEVQAPKSGGKGNADLQDT